MYFGFNLPTLLLVLTVVMVYMLLSDILGVRLVDLAVFIKNLIASGTKKSAAWYQARNMRKFKAFTYEEKKKSLSYKMHKFISSIIVGLGWNPAKFTVEFVMITVGLITFAITVLCSLIFTTFITRLIFFILITVGLIAILYLFSRKRSRLRKYYLVETENLLCQGMTNDFDSVVEKNINRIHPLVRKPFTNYLDARNINTPFIDALNDLHEELGSSFDNFFTKVELLNTTGSDGILACFNANIKDNNMKTIKNMNKEARMAEEIFTYKIILVLDLAVFLYATISYETTRSFFLTNIGQILLLFFVGLVVVSFCMIEYLKSLEKKG